LTEPALLTVSLKVDPCQGWERPDQRIGSAREQRAPLKHSDKSNALALIFSARLSADRLQHLIDEAVERD
jgi:hypothetical protein